MVPGDSYANGKDTEANDAPQLQGGSEMGRQISVTLTPSQFEEMYFQPSMKSRAQLENIKRFGNPTSVGIVGFLLTYSPTMAVLMGWRGTTPDSLVGLTGVFYMMGGIALWVGGILEFIVGNTYPCLVFISFGSFWLSLGVTVDPIFNIQGTLGQTGPVFNSAWGFYLIFWAVYVYLLSIAALKTNATLFVIVFTVAVVFNLLGIGYFRLASGDANASTVLLSAGAVGFVTTIAGFYLLLHLILASVEFPINVPLGDFSRFFKKKE